MALLVAAVVAGGVVATHIGKGWADPGLWVPDLVAGWALAAAGAVAWWHRVRSFVGPLLIAAAVTWFVGSVAPVAVLAHRGPIVHALLSFPDGRLRSWSLRTVVGTAYLLSIAPMWGGREIAGAALSVLVCAAAAIRVVRAVGPGRRARRAVLPTALLFGGVIGGSALTRLVSPAWVDAAVLQVYQLTVVVVAVGVALALARGTWVRAEVTDLVVALSEREAQRVRLELSRALGDPSLQIGYGSSAVGYVDETGRAMSLPEATGDRVVTRVPLEDGSEAVLVHDPAVLGDRGLLDALSAAARLTAANAALRASLRRQVAETDASRRRLVEAQQRERQRLEQRLRTGGDRQLQELGASLHEVRRRAKAGGRDELAAEALMAETRLAEAREDLERLALGLHPRALSQQGLAESLSELAACSPLPTDVSVGVGELPEAVAAAAYYVCAEGLANAVKHAHASRCIIRLDTSGAALRISVTDDGVGGATLTSGSGLRGLADRLEALGGRLAVSQLSPGTRLAAEIPLADKRG